MTTPDDEPRDAHLQAALRHAPDREAAPPAALSAQILAQARRAAVSRRPAPAGPGWAERWFGWMSRPVAAGAFGSLLIAGFVGLMWREGPPPETAVVVEAPVAVPEAPAPAPPAAPAPAAPPAPPAQVQQKARATPPAVQAPPAPAAVQAPPAPAGSSRDAALESRPAAAAAPPAAVAPLAAPSPAAARQALAAVDPLAPVIAALSAPADSAMRERLQALSEQTRGRWRAVATRAAEADNSAAGASAGPAGEPVFDSQGRLLGHLQADTEQVIWRAADGRIWRAPALR